jgi:putative hydrolase of the HAD superfamily
MLFFDIDNTLLNNDAAQMAAAASVYKTDTQLQDLYSEEAFPGLWNQVTEKYVHQYMTGKISFEQQRRERWMQIFKTDPDEAHMADFFKEYLKAYEDSWQLYPDVIPLLERYKDTPKGIISNGDGDQQRQKLTRTGIDHYFDVVVISSDIGVSKPDPKIFEHAAGQAGKPPSQCWYVGDKVDTDAKAAKDAGFVGVWVNRKFIDEKKEPVPEVISLNDLSYISS